MNPKQHIIPQRIVRFRRWSRKGYAAFASLGQCVTIGQLRKNITERALTKQSEPGVTCASSNDRAETDHNPDSTLLHATPTAVIELLLAALSPQIASTLSEPYRSPIYSINRGRDALNASCNSPLHNEGHKELQDAFNASLPISPYQL